MTYHQVIPLAARRVSILNLERLLKMDSDGQTTPDQNMPGAVEVGNVEVWVLGRCDNPSVCMQISTTAFPRRKRKVGYLNDIDNKVFMLLSLSPLPPTGDFSKCKQQKFETKGDQSVRNDERHNY